MVTKWVDSFGVVLYEYPKETNIEPMDEGIRLESSYLLCKKAKIIVSFDTMPRWR